MNPEEALALVEQATEPQMAGKITREGFAKLQEAIATLRQTVSAVETLNAANNTRAQLIGELEARLKELEGAKTPA